MKPEWEMVATNTYRLKVPGGWIYRFSINAMVFVPEPKNWEDTY